VSRHIIVSHLAILHYVVFIIYVYCRLFFEGNCDECPAVSLLAVIEWVNLWQKFFYDHDFHARIYPIENSVLYKTACKERIKLRFVAPGVK